MDSITNFLKETTRTRTLVLILDNLHGADRSTLLSLEFVGQELGEAKILIVGTYRDVDFSLRHPLSETLGQLTQGHLFQRIALRGLNHESLGKFIQATIGISPPDEFVKMMYSHTEGNPLFLTEVVRVIEQEGRLLCRP